MTGKDGNEMLAMSPANLTVARGTTVKFQMSKGSYEAHTATFGPGDAEKEPASYLGAIAASFAGPAPDARAVYPSETPGTMASLSPTPARQRVLELGRARQGQRVAAAGFQQRQVRHSGDVHVLLHDPPVHARYRHRSVRRLTALTTLIGAASLLAAPSASGATRDYWVAAVPVTWNIVPNQRDAIMGMEYTPSRPSSGRSSTGATRATGAGRSRTSRPAPATRT